jgi:hypothetical protein
MNLVGIGYYDPALPSAYQGHALGKMYTITPGPITILGQRVNIGPVDVDVPVEQAVADAMAQIKPQAQQFIDQNLAKAQGVAQQEAGSVKYWLMGFGVLLVAGLYYVVKKAR